MYSEANLRDKKILLFDTSITMARAFEIALKNSGYQVRRTMDPEEILIEMMIFRPEIIILEKKSLREELKTEIEKKSRNIIYSAKSADVDGTERYVISRPFNTDELLRIVENLFNQKNNTEATVREEAETFIEEFIEEEPVIIENPTVEELKPEPAFSEKDLGDIEEDVEDFGAIEINNKPEPSLTKKEPSAPMLLDEQFEEIEEEIKEEIQEIQEEEPKESILVDDFVKPRHQLESEISKMNKIEEIKGADAEDEIFSMVMKDLDSFTKSEEVVYNKEYTQEQTLEENEEEEKQLAPEKTEKEEIDSLIEDISSSSEIISDSIIEENQEEESEKTPEISEIKEEPQIKEDLFDITDSIKELEASFEESFSEEMPEQEEEYSEKEEKPEEIIKQIEEPQQKTDIKKETTITKSTILEISDMDLLDLTKTNIDIKIEDTENKRLDRLEQILTGADKQKEEKQKTIAVTREEIRTMIKEELGQIMREYFWEEASAIVKEAVENKIKELATDE